MAERKRSADDPDSPPAPMTRRKRPLDLDSPEKGRPRNEDATATLSEGDFREGRKNLVLRDEVGNGNPEAPAFGQPSPGREASASNRIFRAPARIWRETPKKTHSEATETTAPRHGGPSPRGQPRRSESRGCSHPTPKRHESIRETGKKNQRKPAF